MSDQSRRQLHRATVVFWVLLVYIIAALLWWLFSLEQQNKTIHALKKEEISVIDTTSQKYENELLNIEDLQRRNSTKYLAEGIIFLLLILLGAVYVYQLANRQFQLQKQQQNFVMAVTHELKTPIAIARLNLETLQKHQLNEKMRRKLMGITVQETMRLDTLINNILISSQLDIDAYKGTREDLNLSQLTEDVLGQFANRYPDRKLYIDIEEDIDIKGDTLLLKLMISNLLENANKYSDKVFPIACRLYKEASTIRLRVTDKGTGIADGEKKKVFNKFYRVGNEETRKKKGTGLGLYICQKIVSGHGGEIVITDNKPRGCTFTVIFTE